MSLISLLHRSLTCPEDPTKAPNDICFAGNSTLIVEPDCAIWDNGFSCTDPNLHGHLNWLFNAITCAIDDLAAAGGGGGSSYPSAFIAYNAATHQLTKQSAAGAISIVNLSIPTISWDCNNGQLKHTAPNGDITNLNLPVEWTADPHERVVNYLQTSKAFAGSSHVQNSAAANTVVHNITPADSIPPNATHGVFMIESFSIVEVAGTPGAGIFDAVGDVNSLSDNGAAQSDFEPVKAIATVTLPSLHAPPAGFNGQIARADNICIVDVAVGNMGNIKSTHITHTSDNGGTIVKSRIRVWHMGWKRKCSVFSI